ncbi:adenylate cyclase associated C terminal-domain-containing protein [Haematococcus lacustris]
MGQGRQGANGAAGVAALADSKGRAAGGGEALSALFQELQKGEAITQGLKKVTDDMKTKNRADRGEGRVALTCKTEPAAPHQGGSRSAGAAGAKPPRVHYDPQRKKWLVEHQVGARGLVLQDVQANQGVYIFGCTDSLIQVPAKVNTISIDSCTKTGIVFGDLIAGCEVVNCRALQLQCTGTVPTVSIEKTDGAQVFLTEQLSRNPAFQVVTAKCSEINVVVVPDAAAAEAGADSAEHAIPEQFISTFSPDGKLVTVAAAHSGA